MQHLSPAVLPAPKEANKPDRFSLSGQRLPLVSLILCNWNYGEFVGLMIDSIRAQTYPNIEAVVIDNASTDGSREIIARHIAADPRFRVVHAPENEGPMGAALRGLAMTTGSLVCFLDADDYLLTDYVSTHVQVHLALPLAVAVTSGNVIEVAKDGTIICASRSPFARERPAEKRGLRPAGVVPRVEAIDDETYLALSGRVCRVDPQERGSHWSPGTANCYRRFILDMVKPQNPAAIKYISPDGHFTRMCHWLAGSAIIDKPLSAYRLHGNNYYVAAPSVTGIIASGGPALKNIPLRRREILRLILERALPLSLQIGKARYWDVLEQSIEVLSGPLEIELRNDEVRSLFASSFPKIVEHFGARVALHKLGKRMSFRRLRQIVRQAYDGKVPARITRLMILEEVKSFVSLRRFRRRGR